MALSGGVACVVTEHLVYRQEKAMFAWFAMPALVTAFFAVAVYQHFSF
jgi:hypothetical protein